jgi:hypothetical protein
LKKEAEESTELGAASQREQKQLKTAAEEPLQTAPSEDCEDTVRATVNDKVRQTSETVVVICSYLL